MDRSLFEKIEDWFLDHPAVENKCLEDIWFWICRTKNKFFDLYWYGPRNFLSGIWVFRSYLWEHHWFDHHYLLKLLRIKLAYDYKHYLKYGMAVSADKYALQMKECVDIIDRMIEDDYDESYLDAVDKKWGVPTFYERFEKNSSVDNLMSDSDREKTMSHEEKTAYWKDRSDAYNDADKDRQSDTKKLFKIMSDNIWNWWD